MKALLLVGVPTWLGAIILNAGNWKADVLWLFALLVGVIRLGFYCWKTWQIIRMNELDIKEREKALSKKR